jgi:hypothetical protein
MDSSPEVKGAASQGCVTAAIWLLASGFVRAALAFVAAPTDCVGAWHFRGVRGVWLLMIANAPAVVLEAVNLAL